MSEIQNEAYAKACQEIEKLRLENSQLRENCSSLRTNCCLIPGCLDICIGLMPRLSEETRFPGNSAEFIVGN
jgi:hypothetical protein